MHNKECNFNSVKRLYHYTSMKSAFNILESMTLRFSELNRMNDINESYKYIYSELVCGREKIKWGFPFEEIGKEIAKYKQISLTMDKRKRIGFYIPAMWAHYADKGEGVCIVFNQDKLLDRLPAIVEHKEVRYSEEYNNDIVVKRADVSADVSTFLKTNSIEFFFTKTKDWSYEQEYRLFSFDNGIQDISIEDCVIAVLVLNAKDVTCDEYVSETVDYRILQKIIPNTPILKVSQFFGDVSVADKIGNTVWASNLLLLKK